MRSYCNIFGALHLAFVANAEMTVSRIHGLMWGVLYIYNMDRYMYNSHYVSNMHMHYPVHLYPHLGKLHRPLTQDSFAWLCHLSHALLLCSGAACWVVAEKASSVGKVRKPCCLRLLDEIVFF